MLGKLKKRIRLKTHGFLKRSAVVLNRRRSKGRKSLTVKIHSKGGSQKNLRSQKNT
ncbi:50S ribosomal protein L34 [Candidatus Gracilibacteria bacterium]|nr:50S ribosomal protein L34 [Candidatus Gracilibacteria bacterium]